MAAAAVLPVPDLLPALSAEWGAYTYTDQVHFPSQRLQQAFSLMHSDGNSLFFLHCGLILNF